MRLLYPSNPLRLHRPDDVYADEFSAAEEAGLSVSVFSFEDFTSGAFRTRPTIAAGDTVLYRGWMLTPPEYAQLIGDVAGCDACMLTNAT